MGIDLKITSTYAGKSVSSTVSDISPAATNAELAQLGRKVIGFSDGTYEKGQRIETINVDTTPGGGVKPEPTLTLDKNSVALSELALSNNPVSSAMIKVTTNSDGYVYFRPAEYKAFNQAVAAAVNNEGGKSVELFKIEQGSVGTTVAQTAYIGVTATDNYASKEVAFTITA